MTNLDVVDCHARIGAPKKRAWALRDLSMRVRKRKRVLCGSNMNPALTRRKVPFFGD